MEKNWNVSINLSLSLSLSIYIYIYIRLFLCMYICMSGEKLKNNVIQSDEFIVKESTL